MAEPATSSSKFWNVPNSLSVARMALSVVVFVLIAYEKYLAAATVFSLAAITDALDGHLARMLDQVTAVGRQLDPLVDKVIVAGTYIYLLGLGPDGTGLHPWMVTTIVIRELLIQGLRSHLEGMGQAFGAKSAGKLKTVIQCLSIIAILLGLSFKVGPPLSLGRDILTWLAVGLTVYSGLGYVLSAFPFLREKKAPGEG